MARQGGAGTCVASASAMLPSRRRSRCAPDATNYFFGFPGQEEELELTFNHDRRSYEIGTAYGHIAIGWTISMRPLPGWRSKGSSRSGRPTVFGRVAAV
jgi:hypothetical protein